MTRDEYKAALEEAYPDRYELQAVMLAAFDAERGAFAPAPAPNPDNAQPEGDDASQ